MASLDLGQRAQRVGDEIAQAVALVQHPLGVGLVGQEVTVVELDAFAEPLVDSGLIARRAASRLGRRG